MENSGWILGGNSSIPCDMDKAEIQEAILKLSGFERDQLRRWHDTKQQIEEITEAVVRLTHYHAIWWEIMNRDTAKHYDGVRREYFDFFEPVGLLAKNSF
jgi:hypothetical protein